MALIVADRVRETTSTVGTGAFALGGAQPGFQAFSAVLTNGDTTYYACAGTTEWEVGVGTWNTGNTLSRTTILASSNGGSIVNFSAGAKDIFISYPASRSVYQNAAGTSTVQQAFSSLSATSANITTATLTSGTISTTPASATDIANKTYVDTIASSGITYHSPVKYEVPVTTGNLNAIYNQPGGPGVGVGATLTNNGTLAAFAPDGPTAAPGDRILIYNQTNAFENGVYTVTTVGNGSTPWVLTRATDADTYAVKSPNGLGLGDAFFITSGNTGAGETYVCNTSGTITFGTTAINFVQVSSAQIYSAGTGLTLSGTQFSITNTGVGAATYGSASSVPVIGVNAQGQITSATNTTIAITGAQVSGNIAGSAGSVANALTAGSYLTSGGTYDGSVARTFAVDATTTNTASKVVARDASGDFSAGTITASLSGNATSANTSTNISGGTANQIPYQASAGTTTFVAAPTTANTYLSWTGSAYTWAATGTFTSATISGSLTLSGGTANGVAYLNGSNVLTTGSALTFDGTNLKTTGSVLAGGAVPSSGAGVTLAYNGSTTGYIYSYDWGSSVYKTLNIAGGTIDISAANNTQVSFGVNGSEQMRLTSTGLGIGTSSPATKLHVYSTTARPITAGNASATWTFGPTSTNFAFRENSSGSDFLTIDSSGNLGIGTSSPASFNAAGLPLVVGSGSGNTGMTIYSGTASNGSIHFADGTTTTDSYRGIVTYSHTNNSMAFYTDATLRATLDSSGNLGLGVTPSAWTTVASTTALQITNFGAALSSYGGGNTWSSLTHNAYFDGTNWKYTASSIGAALYQMVGANSGSSHSWSISAGGTAGNAITFTQAMTLDSSGNLGLGVTPSASWQSGRRALQIGQSGVLHSFGTTPSQLIIGANNVLDGTNYLYLNTGLASMYNQTNGVHSWFTAPSGTAGNAITFTQAMTLDSSGNLGLGLTPSAWGINYRVVEFDQGTSASGFIGDANNQFMVGRNAYHNGTNWTYYASSTPALLYQQSGAGDHMWYNAPSGTAGSTITFTQRMTLDASGNFLLGTTTSPSSSYRTVLRQSGTSNPDATWNVGGWTLASVGAEPTLYLSSNVVAATGVAGAAQTAKGGIGFRYVSAANPTELDIGIIGSPTVASPVCFYNNTERARIDSSGNFGIGTGVAALTQRLTVYTGSATQTVVAVGNTNTGGVNGTLFGVDSSGNALITQTQNLSLFFSTNNTNRARIDASGNFALGNIVPSTSGAPQFESTTLYLVSRGNAYFSNNATFNSNFIYIASATAAQYNISGNQHIWSNAAAGTAGNTISWVERMRLDASGNLGLGVGVTPVSGFTILEINNSSQGGKINLLVNGTKYSEWTTNGASNVFFGTATTVPLVFRINAVERARLTYGASGGYFKASSNGSYVASSGAYHELCKFEDQSDPVLRIQAQQTTSTNQNALLVHLNADPNNTTNYFIRGIGGAGPTERFMLRSNGGLANFSANDVNLSDRREKTNFAPAKSYIDAICAIPVQTFNYIDQSEDDPGLTLGVVAQDVQAVAPELVMESNWGSEDNPKMRLSIYQTDLQYALMKCIQELKSELDSVKAELAVLKGA